MKVFVSWSGNLSQAVAAIFDQYLPCMIQDLDVFMSKHDIGSGIRWATKLASELDESNFGIMCLTASNISSPWVLFEAGALTKHMEGRACGLLIGELAPADVAGPLAQFQHRRFLEDDVKALIEDINAKLETPLPTQQLQMIFQKWWPDMISEYETVINAVEETSSTESGRGDRDILEEILSLSRSTAEAVYARRTAIRDDHADHLLRLVVSRLPADYRRVFVRIWERKADGDTRGAQQIAKKNPEAVSSLVDLGIAKFEDDELMIHSYFRMLSPTEFE